MRESTNDGFEYDSIQHRTEGLYREKGSKFIAYLMPVQSKEEVEERLSEIKSLHPKSRHVCYAYRIGPLGEAYRINDDGEPSGSAGLPIYNVLLSEDVTDVMAAVVRYFGGTKLGVAGLIRAYKQSTEEAFYENEKVRIVLTHRFRITYPIKDMGKMYELLKAMGVEKIDPSFGAETYLEVRVPLREKADFARKLIAKYHGYQPEDIDDAFESEFISVADLEE